MSNHKSAAVILIHDQEANLPRLIASYKAQVIQPDLYVFVLDRCRDNSKSILTEYAKMQHIKIVEVERESDFQAGYNRDIGLNAAEKEYPDCDVMFFDGDCILTPNVVASHLEIIQCNPDYPTIAVGRRICESESTTIEEDHRIKAFHVTKKVFTYGMHRLVVARELANARMLTWSCNFAFNRHAIDLCKHVNFELNRESRVFNPIFDGRWGGEDDFIGLTTVHFGIAVVSVNPEHYVQHIWHPSRMGQLYVGTIELKIHQLKYLASRLDAPGVTAIRTARVIDDLNRAIHATSVDIKSPIISMLLSKYDKIDQALLATIFSGQVRWELDDRIIELKTDTDRILRLRIELSDLQCEPIDAMKTLKTLSYNWKWPESETCNICGSKEGFSGSGRCRSCNSYPWHRQAKLVKFEGAKKLVFNADFRGERLLFKGWDFASYTGLNGDLKLDMEKIDLPDASYDVVYSAHTLEHIKDESIALSELHRILKPGGILYLALPIQTDNAKTLENVTDQLTPRERRMKFGWHDHYRLYGKDVLNRLSVSAFKIDMIQAWQQGKIDGTPANETLFVLSKK